MKKEPKTEYAKVVEYIAGQDIDTCLLMKFITAQQNIDWRGIVNSCVEKGMPKETALAYANGALGMLDELIGFLIEQGALVENTANEA